MPRDRRKYVCVRRLARAMLSLIGKRSEAIQNGKTAHFRLPTVAEKLFVCICTRAKLPNMRRPTYVDVIVLWHKLTVRDERLQSLLAGAQLVREGMGACCLWSDIIKI